MMTRSLTWNSIFLVHREDAEERQRSMVDHGLEAQEWGSGQPSPHTMVTLQACGLQSPEASGAGSLHGALICLIAQRGGVQAAPQSNSGAEVHRFLGEVGRWELLCA